MSSTSSHQVSLHQSGRQVMLVAGEASGDLHGANLIRAMRAMEPGLQVCGMGGPELVRAGMELLYDAARLAVVGVVEILTHLGDIIKARRALLHRLRQDPPGLLILIDYPDFNLRLAAKAKKLGIPIFYYISPQIWAWRKSRVHTIMALADRVAVILPFEQAFYQRFGYTVDFVGHPLVETVRAEEDRAQFTARLGLDPSQKRLVGLMPGSRRKEAAALLPLFLEAAALLAGERPQDYCFLIPLASTLSLATLEQSGLAAYQQRLDIRVLPEGRYSLMAACEVAAAASGTLLLELALLNTPLVAAYRVSRNTYRLGRLLVRGVRWFSLVNLIVERELVPELLQDEATPQRIAAELRRLLEDATARQAMLAGYAEVRASLGEPGASKRAALLALALLHRSASAGAAVEASNKTLAASEDESEETATWSDEPLVLPIDGELDLHTFHPGEVKTLVTDYMQACQDKGIYQVRIVHGKGKGVLRRTVHALLDRSELVQGYRLADESAGSWGATLVTLRSQQAGAHPESSGPPAEAPADLPLQP